MLITEFLELWQQAREDANIGRGCLLPDTATVRVLQGTKIVADDIVDLELEVNPDGRYIMWIKIGD